MPSFKKPRGIKRPGAVKPEVSPMRSRYQDELREWAAKNNQSGGLYVAPPAPSWISRAVQERSQQDRCEI